jgi:hypothetical protein
MPEPRSLCCGFQCVCCGGMRHLSILPSLVAYERLPREPLRLALRRTIEKANKLVDDSRSVGLWRDVSRDQPLGLDAERSISAERCFELGGAVSHSAITRNRRQRSELASC